MSGMNFLGLNIWDNHTGNVNYAISSMYSFFIVFFVFIFIISASGVHIGKQSHPKNWMVGAYGVSVLFLVCIPLFVEGFAFKEA
jgi:hypothetical protein